MLVMATGGGFPPPPEGRLDPLLDAERAGEILGVSAYTVRQWAREGRLPAVHLGKFWRFRESALASWIEDQERAPR